MSQKEISHSHVRKIRKIRSFQMPISQKHTDKNISVVVLKLLPKLQFFDEKKRNLYYCILRALEPKIKDFENWFLTKFIFTVKSNDQ